MERMLLRIILRHGTGPYWDKKMVSAEINQVVKEVQEYVEGKRNG